MEYDDSWGHLSGCQVPTVHSTCCPSTDLGWSATDGQSNGNPTKTKLTTNKTANGKLEYKLLNNDVQLAVVLQWAAEHVINNILFYMYKSKHKAQ